VNLVTPISPVSMGGLTLPKVATTSTCAFVRPFLVVVFVVVRAFLGTAAATS
jgi:uncharacterized ion transporter superfamily protein YfcC